MRRVSPLQDIVDKEVKAFTFAELQVWLIMLAPAALKIMTQWQLPTWKHSISLHFSNQKSGAGSNPAQGALHRGPATSLSDAWQMLTFEGMGTI